MSTTDVKLGDADEALRTEVGALRALAQSLVNHAPFAAEEIAPWFEAAAGAESADALFRDLRRRWLRASHAAANAHLRSPCSDEATRLPSGRPVDFGYERELDPARLEGRADRFLPPPQGWHGRQIVFSSGQASLSALLLVAAGAARTRPLQIAHIGGYFETTELARLFGAEIAARDEDDGAIGACDLAILEPVYLRDGFRCLDLDLLVEALKRHGCPPLIAVDATLCHRRFPMQQLAQVLPRGAACRLVRLSSLLKLDQAGFELANGGLMSLYAREEMALDGLAERLVKARSITGTGLGFADLCALDVPWLFDEVSDAYANAVFANNAHLAQALADAGSAGISHPMLNCAPAPWAVAPYVVATPGDAGRCHAIADAIEQEATSRGLGLQRGGSFGFRTHRFDVVEPEGEAPFLRFAMGASPVSRGDAFALIRRALGAN